MYRWYGSDDFVAVPPVMRGTTRLVVPVAAAFRGQTVDFQ
jgi:hypothetical protein